MVTAMHVHLLFRRQARALELFHSFLNPLNHRVQCAPTRLRDCLRCLLLSSSASRCSVPPFPVFTRTLPSRACRRNVHKKNFKRHLSNNEFVDQHTAASEFCSLGSAELHWPEGVACSLDDFAFISEDAHKNRQG